MPNKDEIKFDQVPQDPDPLVQTAFLSVQKHTEVLPGKNAPAARKSGFPYATVCSPRVPNDPPAKSVRRTKSETINSLLE